MNSLLNNIPDYKYIKNLSYYKHHYLNKDYLNNITFYPYYITQLKLYSSKVSIKKCLFLIKSNNKNFKFCWIEFTGSILGELLQLMSHYKLHPNYQKHSPLSKHHLKKIFLKANNYWMYFLIINQKVGTSLFT
jgi:hypothetical protein